MKNFFTTYQAINLLTAKSACYQGVSSTISKTSARVSSGFQTRENIWNHEAAGRVVLLFSSDWKLMKP